MPNLVEFEGETLSIRTANSNLTVDLSGNLVMEVTDYKDEVEKVRGLGDRLLLFIDRLLERGYDVVGTEVRWGISEVKLKAGDFVLEVILNQGLGKSLLTVSFKNSEEKLLFHIESKYVAVEYQNLEFGFAKRYYEEDSYWRGVRDLLIKHRIAVVYGSLKKEIADDRLYFVTQEGVKVVELAPEQWKMFFVACSGWGLISSVYYQWVLNVVKKHYNKLEIRKISDGYEVKYGNLTIWYRRKGFRAEYRDGIRIEFSRGKVIGQYEDRLYFEEEDQFKSAWEWVREIKKVLHSVIKSLGTSKDF